MFFVLQIPVSRDVLQLKFILSVADGLNYPLP